MFRRFAVCALLAAVLLSVTPTRSPAASKEIQELQRDVAQLQDQIRQMRESQDRQLTVLTTLVQQALDTSKSSTTGVAVIQSSLQQSLKDMEAKVAAPVAGLSTRLDALDQDMRVVQQSVGDVNASMNKLQQQLGDLSKAVSILQAPAPPPPAAAGGGSGGGGGVATTVPPPEAPCQPASQLYPAANSDRQGGNYELAVKEYADYLRCYGNLPLAPNAQFYIGVIHALEGDNQSAVQDFDAVLEKYPDNNKTPDALYAKGLALVKLGRLTDGGNEFAEVIKRFSAKNPDLATQACDQRKKMGLGCGVPARTVGKKK